MKQFQNMIQKLIQYTFVPGYDELACKGKW